MRYYRCKPIEDPNMVLIGLRGDDNLRVSDSFTRGPVLEWQPPALVTYRGDQAATPEDAPLFDRSFQLLSGLWPLFDEELASVLRPLLVSPGDGEFLHARLANRELTLYNCWRVVQAYDDAASEYRSIPGVIGPKFFSRPVLAASKLKEEAHFFHLTPFAGQLVLSEAVRDIMTDVGRLAEHLIEVEIIDH